LKVSDTEVTVAECIRDLGTSRTAAKAKELKPNIQSKKVKRVKSESKSSLVQSCDRLIFEGKKFDSTQTLIKTLKQGLS
jgi:hypothetical protein